jgi:hypothetical protein
MSNRLLLRSAQANLPVYDGEPARFSSKRCIRMAPSMGRLGDESTRAGATFLDAKQPWTV